MDAEFVKEMQERIKKYLYLEDQKETLKALTNGQMSSCSACIRVNVDGSIVIDRGDLHVEIPRGMCVWSGTHILRVIEELSKQRIKDIECEQAQL